MSGNAYHITMAVAGFSAEEVELTQHGPELTVTGQKKPEEGDRQLLHRGLAFIWRNPASFVPLRYRQRPMTR